MMGDTVGRVTRYNGSTWSAPVTIDPGQALRSMSCPTASFCAVTDDVGNVLTWNGTTWSAPAPVGLSFSAVVSCASANLCLAVGDDGSPSGAQSQYDGVSWSTVTPGAPTLMSLVSCADTVCVAVAPAYPGNTAVNSTSSTFSGTAWSSLVVVEADRTLVDASCASSTFCAAVDATGTAYTYNGTTWSAGVRIDNVAVPTAISCTSAFCVVVDDGGGAVRYSGGTWLPRVSLGSSITTVSCASSTFCVATMGTTVSTWNGSAWSAATALPAPGIGSKIMSVSCTGTQICTTVDSSGYSLDDTPTGWTAPHLVPGSVYANALTSVSCVSANFCATVGSAGGFVRQNGTWSQVPLPASIGGLGSSSSTGHEISCVATNYCLVTGMSQTYDWMVASYDGQQWAILHTFSYPNGAFGTLAPLTVSCALDQTCLINLRERGNAIVAWGTRT